MGRKKGSKNEVDTINFTYTPQAEIEICENCPHPKPICGQRGCEHFKQEKAKLLQARDDKRRLCGKLRA